MAVLRQASTGMRGIATVPSYVVMQPTTLCNLDCSYCYLPFRADRPEDAGRGGGGGGRAGEPTGPGPAGSRWCGTAVSRSPPAGSTSRRCWRRSTPASSTTCRPTPR